MGKIQNEDPQETSKRQLLISEEKTKNFGQSARTIQKDTDILEIKC